MRIRRIWDTFGKISYEPLPPVGPRSVLTGPGQ